MRFIVNPLLSLSSRGRVNIFIFHRVMMATDLMRPGEPDRVEFEVLMRCIRARWSVISLAEAVEGLLSNSLPERAAVLTFDDGYADNITLAGPLLKRLGMPATVFLASGFLNGGRMWNDTVIEAVRRYSGDVLDLESLGLDRYVLEDEVGRRKAAFAIISRIKYAGPEERRRVTDYLEDLVGELPDDLMLTEAQIAEGRDLGISFGAHTVSHPILARLDEGQARQEIFEGKADIESITGSDVDLFAYPNGKLGEDYTQRDVDLVRKAGFKAAVATNWGVADMLSDPLQLPRFTPWRHDCLGFTLQMLRHYWR